VPFTLLVLENTGQETNYKYKFDSTIQLFTDKYNSETANNTKHSKTKLPWFSRLLLHLAAVTLSAKKFDVTEMLLWCYFRP